jgi:hypothetical protein
MEQKIAAVDQWIAGNDQSSLQKAASELLEICAGRNAELRKVAVDRLAILARRDPLLLLDGLANPNLTARIAASNLLRERLGSDFNIDPWADASARTSDIAAWRKKLGR